MRGPRHGRACCVGARPPPTVGRVVSVCGPSQRGCCARVRPTTWSSVLLCCVAPSCWGVLNRCVAPLMVGHAVLVPVRRGGCAWCGGAGRGLSSCVPPGGRRSVRVGGACGGVLAGALRGLFCLFGVVFAAIQSACSDGWGRRLGCGCGSVDRLAGVGAVLVRSPPHGWAYCVGACPPPMVGRAVLVCGPPHGGACCVGLWSPSWWGVLCWCAPASWWGVLCRRVPPPRGGACCVGVCPPPRGGACCVSFRPPSWWGVLRWCVAPLSVGRVASVPARRGRGVWFGVSSSVRWVVVTVVLLAWPGLVCAPSPVGACPVCAWRPLGGECCVGVFGFRFVVL